MRHLCASAVVVGLVLGMLGPPLSVGQMAATAPPPGAASKAPSVGVGSTQRFFYMGAESCGASTCHGSAAPRNAPRTGIRQTEYTQWQTNDKHAEAYKVLLKERSRVMAQNLRLAEPPSKSNRCVVCHSLYAPKELQSASYKVEDGVSCEACHGQAEGWLGTHIARGYAASASIGMYDTR